MTTALDPCRKIMTLQHARAWRAQLGGTLVFTNGVFDLLHVGHVDLLRAARTQGAALLVALNTDASVRRLKGPQRPVRSAEERAYVVAALEAVDAVILFDEDTPLQAILALAPEVLVKGGDYHEDTVVGGREVRAAGGRVVIVPLTPGHSTTSIVEKLRAQPADTRRPPP